MSDNQDMQSDPRVVPEFETYSLERQEIKTSTQKIPLKKYEVRPGTVDSGKDYEQKVSALVALRCIHQGVEDMWLVSNAKDTGAFDDIILKINRTKCDPLVLMVQLKHKDNSNNILETELLAPRGNFSLLKYSQDIEKLHQAIHSDTKKQIIRDLAEFRHIKFVLFTNRGINDCKFFEKCSRYDDVLSFLNTSYVGGVFRLVENPDIKVVGDNLYLCANQASVKHIDEEIVAEIRNIIDPLGISNLNFEDLAKGFLLFIMEWAKGNLGGHFYLTKEDVVYKLIELFLQQFMLVLEPQSYHQDEKQIWKQILAHQSITVINTDKIVLKFLNEFISYEVGKCLDYDRAPSTWIEELSKDAQQLFYKTQSELKIAMLKSVGNYGKIKPLDIYKSMWRLKKLPLIVTINCTNDYNSIINVLKLSNNYKVVILHEGVQLPTSKSHLENLTNLNEFERDLILTQRVKLQGRAGAMLKNLLTEGMLQYIKCKDIIHILTNNFNIGNVPETLPEYFVERTIIKTVVKSEILQKHESEIFLIESKSPQRKLKQMMHKLEDVDFDQLQSIPGLISFKEITSEQLEKLTSARKPVHILSVYDANYLGWKWSHGSKRTIELFKVQLEYRFEEMVKKFLTGPVIMSGDPGMGKSVLMDYVTCVAPVSKWVLRVDLSRFLSYFKRCKTNTTAQKHLWYFYNRSKGEKLSDCVFEHLLDNKNVVCLFDAFDEVSSYTNEVTGIIQAVHGEGFPVWVTTRQIMQQHLEEMLRTGSVTIKSFTAKDQEQFLFNYFTATHADLNQESAAQIIGVFVEKLMAAARDNLNDRDEQFMGIPLQTKLLADVFSNQCRECLHENSVTFNSNFNLLYLYRKFIDERINVFLSKYDSLAGYLHKTTKEDQSLFALELIFPLDDFPDSKIIKNLHNSYEKEPEKRQLLERVGIITVDENFNIYCLHRTMAEYLSAEWLAKNVIGGNEHDFTHNLIKERFTGNYQFLFSIFDRILANDSPLHLAILSEQIESTLTIIGAKPESVNETDEGGRSALHIAALNGFHYPLPYDEFNRYERDSDKMLRIVQEIVKRNPTYKTDALGYSPLDYALANCSLAIANELKEKSINVYINLDYKFDYLCYCNYHHPDLFHLLLPYFVSRDFLLKNTKRKTSMKYYAQFTDRWNDTVQLKEASKYDKLTVQEFLASNHGRIYSGHVKRLLPHFTDVRHEIILGRNIKLQDNTVINQQDVNKCTLLHYAVLHEKLEVVKMLLNKGADINRQNYENNTPLHLSVLRLNVDITQLLLSRGALINITNKKGETALHLIRYRKQKRKFESKMKFNRRKKIIDLFLAHGVEIDAQNEQGETILHLVTCGSLYIDTITYLLKKGVDINKKTLNNETALHLASAKGYTDIVKLLVDNGAHISGKNKDGNTPLHLMSMSGQRMGTKFLIDNGANIHAINNEGNTPLHLALIKGYMETVQMLVENGADIHAVNQEGNTPLHLATMKDYMVAEDTMTLFFDRDTNTKDVVELLIDRGTNIGTKDNSPLHVALTKGYIYAKDTVKLLVDKGANINAVNVDGNTPLHLVSMKGYVYAKDVVKLLIDHGANIHAVNKEGNTALHLASLKDYKYAKDIVKLLIDEGSRIYDVNKEGNTPLHLALMKGYMYAKDIVKLLAENRANVNAINKEGNMPLHLALMKDYMSAKDIIQVLINKGAHLHATTKEGNTPLHLASMKGYTNAKDIVKLLVDKGSNINAVNDEGDTSLHLAATKCYIYGKNIAEVLIDRGSNMNAVNKEGNTPLHLTSMYGNLHITQQLILKGAKINLKNIDDKTPLDLALLNGFEDIAKEFQRIYSNVN